MLTFISVESLSVEALPNQLSREISSEASLASDTSESIDNDWYSNRGARKPHEMDSPTPAPPLDKPSQNRKGRGKAQSKTTVDGSKITRLKSDSKAIYDAL